MVRTRLHCLLTILLALSVTGPGAYAENQLSGLWQLNSELSDNVEDMFDGKLRRSRLPTSRQPAGERSRHEKTAQDVAQEAYWDQLRENRERRSMKNLRRLGTAFPLLTAERLEISASDGSYTITYDDLLPRTIKPNPGGRVFTASGDELSRDSIGYTLTYWENDELVLETDPPEGGKFIEHIALKDSPERIEYRIKVDIRDLEEAVEVRRVFERAGGQTVLK